ncbi:MAG TPA: archaellin/type IV pilin N-terminal domain-containing protein, partial [Candidatus Thermoplasmatota archaeon]|nr:archaellin/type IV pilin N-terminal domain-containing protein [Candidatus Thermoplasmatota archaeon]
MKANRKFLHGDEEAVSPVIAVILMVAITVVLAATVYVWVSGFGSNSNSTPAHTMSITSSGALAAGAGNLYWKNYTVSSADPSLTYGDLKLAIGGTQFTYTPSCGVVANSTAATSFLWGGCGGTVDRALAHGVLAGDRITIVCYDNTPADGDCLTNKDLLILDVQAN